MKTKQLSQVLDPGSSHSEGNNGNRGASSLVI